MAFRTGDLWPLCLTISLKRIVVGETFWNAHSFLNFFELARFPGKEWSARQHWQHTVKEIFRVFTTNGDEFWKATKVRKMLLQLLARERNRKGGSDILYRSVSALRTLLASQKFHEKLRESLMNLPRWQRVLKGAHKIRVDKYQYCRLLIKTISNQK